MMQIRKYRISPDPTILVNRGAKILSVGMQDKEITIWAMVNIAEELARRSLIIAATGETLGEIAAHIPFIGTVFAGEFVWHIFDGGEIPLKQERTR